MRYFQFCENNEIRTGIVLNGKHMDLAKAAAGKNLPTTMEDIIRSGMTPAEQEAAYAGLDAEAMDPATIDYAPAVTESDKILCVGLNYQEHQKETNLINSAKFPPLFCKFRNSLIGHDHDIKLPACANRFDYEVELVIVIGKEACKVTEAEARDCIFGYTVGNDFSARDLQMATSQWLMGKACDGFAPMGPYLVTADAFDPADAAITCTVNGQLCQNGRTSDMIFDCAAIVSHISQVITLVPGDVIYTGTPSGVILGKPENDRVWLKAGDVVEVAVEGIGVLRNRLV